MGYGQAGMVFSEFEHRRYRKLVGAFVEQHRPPAPVRDRFDLDFRISGTSIVIFERRQMLAPAEQIREQFIAKATWVQQRQLWKVYCPRADLKWRPYPPDPLVPTVEEFLAVVAADPCGCFWG